MNLFDDDSAEFSKATIMQKIISSFNCNIIKNLVASVPFEKFNHKYHTLPYVDNFEMTC